MLISSISARIKCPKYGPMGDRHYEICPTSSYCLYTEAKYSSGWGGAANKNTFDCGSKDNEVWTNTDSVESRHIPDDVKAIYPVENGTFCDVGDGRWCKVTMGPEQCRKNFDCKIIECRCNVDKCHGFPDNKDLLKSTEGGCQKNLYYSVADYLGLDPNDKDLDPSIKEALELASNKEALALSVADTEINCHSGGHGIPCCDQVSRTGDNAGPDGEIFIPESKYDRAEGCAGTCKKLYEASTGITESLKETYSHGAKKCWCEIGAPVFVENNHYQTCMF